jgi:hypothetical protein
LASSPRSPFNLVRLRLNAAECLRLAADATDPVEAAQLRDLGRRFEELARKLEAAQWPLIVTLPPSVKDQDPRQ